MIINQEGGFAAAIVGMMARERLSFHTEVPEQLVVLDPKLSAVDEQYVRILQRYKELLKNSDNFDPEVREDSCEHSLNICNFASISGNPNDGGSCRECQQRQG